MKHFILDFGQVKKLTSGAIRCDGTIGASLYMQDGQVIELDGLGLSQLKTLEYLVKVKSTQKMKVDARLLFDSPENSSHETFCRRNGIRTA